MQWNDPKSYEYTATHTVKDWGWEFIRRDARYIAEWESVFAEFQLTPIHQRLMRFLLAPELSQYSNSDGREAGELNLSNPDDIATFAIPAEQALKWGLRYYQNPKANKLIKENHYIIKSLYRGDTGGEEIEEEITIPIYDHTLLVAIDLIKPIKTQLDEISKIASKLQKKSLARPSPLKAKKVSPKDRKTWTTYLRCLDAQAANVLRKTAASEIFADSEKSEAKFYASLAQIKELEKNNFRLMMF